MNGVFRALVDVYASGLVGMIGYCGCCCTLLLCSYGVLAGGAGLWVFLADG